MESTSTLKLLLKLTIFISISVFILLQLFPIFHLHRASSLWPPSKFSFFTTAPISLFPKQALPTMSGYLKVNSTTGSSIFYTFYEAQSLTFPNLSQTPLLIWLQGGPGCSSLFGNFMEIGPWHVNLYHHHHDLENQAFVLEPNPGSWNRIFGLVFLDNPIGSGFSIASSSEEIPRDQFSMAKHLYIAITKFIELDPMLFSSRPLYVVGESYAGKYVPAIGYYILKKNDESDHVINLAGVAIGNGLIDPETQVATHADNAYFSGLINEKQRREMEMYQNEAIRLAKLKRWRDATNARYRVVDMLSDMTGLATLFDYSKKAPYHKTQWITDFLHDERVKRIMNVQESAVFRNCSRVVKVALYEDNMKSVKYMVELLVKRSKVLLYQGQFDLWDGVFSTTAWVKTLEWEEIGKFLAAERRVWRGRGDELAGYVQRWKSLSNVVVSRAGHLVPADQPMNSQAMIEGWILETGLFGDEQLF
ncbi:PREDICTED: serine carboxypeptidase-like 50 [Fragaria vesca subsp. vesca]|uniref:serine carboxypeptidase-like 50 n=1 Tax=Fragaria vesca subsp. vesca TaxID=101020 RepID=UPI0002C2E298|nr:PREDICTED: serine carboxypeptidase-like 50 [Fragaria vesca subsp. vesca]